MSIAIKRNFIIPSSSSIGASKLYLTSSIASTTIGTGALQVAGGAGGYPLLMELTIISHFQYLVLARFYQLKCGQE